MENLLSGVYRNWDLQLTITADSGISKLKMATTPDSKPQDVVVSVHSWRWRVLCFVLSSHTLFFILTHQILPLLKQDNGKPVDNYPKAVCRQNGTTCCSWVATARLLLLGRHCQLIQGNSLQDKSSQENTKCKENLLLLPPRSCLSPPSPTNTHWTLWQKFLCDSLPSDLFVWSGKSPSSSPPFVLMISHPPLVWAAEEAEEEEEVPLTSSILPLLLHM